MPGKYEDNESLTIGENSYFVDTTDETINSAEFVRLNRQDLAVTSSMDLLPKGFDPTRARILDVACGTGGWIRDVARLHPEIGEIVGIDNNKVVIASNRHHEKTRHNPRVKFELMNILDPFGFPDASFEYVNVRFVSGVLSGKGDELWIAFINECLRVLKPGGTYRLTESEMSWVPYAEATNKMLFALMQVMYKMGKSFASWQLAVTPVLGDLVSKAVTDYQESIIGLNYSYGTKLHGPVVDDWVAVMQVSKKGLISLGGIPEEQFNTLFEQMSEELHSPNFRARWPVVSFTGRKPA